MGLKYLVPPSLLVALVLGSIFFGVASPTEAGAVGSIGATILSMVYKQLTWAAFKENCYITLRVTAMIIFIAVAANLFTGAFLSAGCGEVITEFLLGLGFGPWGIFLTMLCIILFECNLFSSGFYAALFLKKSSEHAKSGRILPYCRFCSC
ncbi:conserved domain protein [delta proteobacterium NaphS2]|nr:conserved domain protein [delta proteobacterium NaphS2]